MTYDSRTESAYLNKYIYSDYFAQIHPENAENQYILMWWTEQHDLLITEEIKDTQWNWYAQFDKDTLLQKIINITSAGHIEVWLDSDPSCHTRDDQLFLPNTAINELITEGIKQLLWHNVMWSFVLARAEKIGLTKVIRQPTWKICPICKEKFVEDSLPIPFIARLGIDNLDYCPPCLRKTVFQGTGNKYASAESIKRYLVALTAIIGRVPTQNFGEGISDLLNLNTDERTDLLLLFKEKPTAQRVKNVFGSWLNALIQAGVLEDGTRKTSRGIHTIAEDGHVCLSLGEKTIDEFLFEHGIQHEKEPRYPEGNYRGDFKVGPVIIEYFGLTGNADYDTKTEEKIRLCEKHNITLIALYPEDLINQKKFEKKLSPCLIKENDLELEHRLSS